MDFPRVFIPQKKNSSYQRLKLGKFFILDYLRDEIRKKRNPYELLGIITEILELYGEDLGEQSAFDVFSHLMEIFISNKMESDASFLKPNPVKRTAEEDKKEKYEYEYRYMAEWINKFAINYHWSLNEILDLDIDLAAYLYQEILLDEFSKREWEYSLTEGAYSYDSNTKKSKYNPMKKPYWMSDEDQPKRITKTLIRKDMLPLGNVQELSGISERLDEIPLEEKKPRKYVH